ICALYGHRQEEADTSFRRLQGEQTDRGHPSLAAHVAWMRGYLLAVSGHLLDSLAEYRRAAAGFEQIGEWSNAGAIHTLLADGLEKLGRHREAWQEVYHGLKAADESANPDDRYLAFAIAAGHSLKQGRQEIALYFQDEVVTAAQGSANATLLPDALFWRAS